MKFLSRLSPRQKARAALALLPINEEEQSAIDNLVSDTMGNPFVGAVLGVDATTTEELVTAYFDNEKSMDGQVYSAFAMKLYDDKFRGAIAAGAFRMLKALPEQHKTFAESAILKISEMDFPEFQRDFDTIEDFIRDGVLMMIANTQDGVEAEISLCVCEKCGHTNYLT